MKNSGKPMQESWRCGAFARTTGQPCRNAGMANGRCRMHGGKSTGRPVIHGRYAKQAMAEMKSARLVLKAIRALLT